MSESLIPFHPEIDDPSNIFPLSIGLVASYLYERRRDDIEVELFKYPEDLSAALDKKVPDIMGFANYSWNYNISCGYARVIKEQWPNTIIVFGGSRIIARWVFADEENYTNRKKSNVIIYGAGSAGRQLSHALQLSREYLHVAYIDDDLVNHGTYINNVPVFSYSKIQSLIEKNNVIISLGGGSILDGLIREKLIKKSMPPPGCPALMKLKQQAASGRQNLTLFLAMVQPLQS